MYTLILTYVIYFSIYFLSNALLTDSSHISAHSFPLSRIFPLLIFFSYLRKFLILLRRNFPSRSFYHTYISSPVFPFRFVRCRLPPRGPGTGKSGGKREEEGERKERERKRTAQMKFNKISTSLVPSTRT